MALFINLVDLLKAFRIEVMFFAGVSGRARIAPSTLY